MSGRIVQISVSPGGVPKTRMTATRVTVSGLESAIRAFQSEGHAVAPGTLGENVISQKRHPGRSRGDARVLATGSISEGDPVRLLTDAEATGARMPAPK